ncbi:MAG: hypothetical protein HUJ78_04080, partial [Mogibacterium sp.]|nr:hypothetical protein [Mogibacterium sp.]
MSNTNDKLHKNRSRRAKIIIVLFLVILLLFLLISLYKNSKYKLLDRAAYEKQTETIAADAAAFNSNEELKNYL